MQTSSQLSQCLAPIPFFFIYFRSLSLSFVNFHLSSPSLFMLFVRSIIAIYSMSFFVLWKIFWSCQLFFGNVSCSHDPIINVNNILRFSSCNWTTENKANCVQKTLVAVSPFLCAVGLDRVPEHVHKRFRIGHIVLLLLPSNSGAWLSNCFPIAATVLPISNKQMACAR